MLSPAEEIGDEQGKPQHESAVDVGAQGPRSPPPYDNAHTGEDKDTTKEEQSAGQKKGFNWGEMSSKIQIIPGNRQGQLNTAYITTLPGIMKIAEIVISFFIFVLAIIADRSTTTAAWTEHIAFECAIVVSILLAGYVIFPHLTIKDEPTREGLIVLELIFYGINTLFWFVSIWLMIHLSAIPHHDGKGAGILSAILCVGITVLFAIETFQKVRAWRAETGATQIINNASMRNGANV